MEAELPLRPEVIGLFLDESRVESSQCCKFITCAVAVISDRWVGMGTHERDFRSPGKGTRLQRITQLLEAANGIAVLADANVDTALLPPGETDSTSDIPQMSWTDNVWSICFLSGRSMAMLRGGPIVECCNPNWPLAHRRCSYTAQHLYRSEPS